MNTANETGKKKTMRKKSGNRWTKEEDDILRRAIMEYGVSQHRDRIRHMHPSILNKDIPIHEYPKEILPVVIRGNLQGDDRAGVCATKWSVIAKNLPGRIGKQCRERWFNHLDPTLKKGKWTPEEDQIIINLQAELGNRWCEISKSLPGRSENAIKNRWNSKMRKRLGLGPKGEKLHAGSKSGSLSGTTKKKSSVAKKQRKGTKKKSVAADKTCKTPVKETKQRSSKKRKLKNGTSALSRGAVTDSATTKTTTLEPVARNSTEITFPLTPMGPPKPKKQKKKNKKKKRSTPKKGTRTPAHQSNGANTPVEVAFEFSAARVSPHQFHNISVPGSMSTPSMGLERGWEDMLRTTPNHMTMGDATHSEWFSQNCTDDIESLLYGFDQFKRSPSPLTASGKSGSTSAVYSSASGRFLISPPPISRVLAPPSSNSPPERSASASSDSSKSGKGATISDASKTNKVVVVQRHLPRKCHMFSPLPIDANERSLSRTSIGNETADLILSSSPQGSVSSSISQNLDTSFQSACSTSSVGSSGSNLEARAHRLSPLHREIGVCL